MNSVILSGFFALSYVALLTGLIFWKKSDEKQNLLLALPLLVLVTVLFGVFVSGIINIFGMPVNILNISVVNAVAGAVLLFISFGEKRLQKYCFRPNDFIAMAVIAVVIALIAKAQFGIGLIPNYETIDPARHLTFAQNVIRSGNINKMYFTNFMNAIIIEFFSPFIGGFRMYKVFVLSDICMLLLSALVFYSAVRQILKKNLCGTLSVILTLAYIIGYPLNNTVFGFVYLGVGVNIGVFMIVAVGLFCSEKIDRLSGTVALMLGAYGIFVCYTLFVPAVYVAVALCIALKFFNGNSLISWRFILCELEVFLVPVILGMYYIYFQFVGEDTVVGMISNEGYIYRSLYAPLLFVLPLALYGIISSVRKKNFTSHFLLFCAMAVFSAVIFVMGMKGQVSSYYYYKTYYMLSPAFFLLAAECVAELMERSKTALLSYGLVWAFLVFMNFGHIDEKIAEKQFLMSPINISGQIFDLYNFNRNCIMSEGVSVIELTLYEQAYDLAADGHLVGIVSTTEPTQWFEAFTNQRLSQFYEYSFDNTDPGEFIEKIVSECEYAVVPSICDERFVPLTEGWEVLFRNEFGKLCRIG